VAEGKIDKKSMAGAQFPVSDKDLKFPHAFLLDASAGSGKTIGSNYSM